MTTELDVAIVGGGPGGSTCGGMVAKYAPELRVGIFEREAFPREHVGESQLPPIGAILNELGCWAQVEAAGFPIKIGATYRWGNSDNLWDFEFMPLRLYREEPRPRSWNLQTSQLALQVDRADYDQILLNHAARLGCTVEESMQVRKIERDKDRVTGLVLADGRRVKACWYVDASGASAVLRRAMDIEIDSPTRLQNIAFWDYWYDTGPVSNAPGHATRVLVLSIGAGWIWYIPLGPSRASIGFVCPRGYFRDSGKSKEELYLWALEQEPLIGELTANARRTGTVRGTKDWSFVADRLVGENWFLVGEAAGFADPILAAGLTLTHTAAREAAYTIVALAQGKHDPDWLRKHYNDNQRTRVLQHIRFADFWYSANGNFTDLQNYTQEIARDAGLDLDPKKAFQWLGTGGFTHDNLGQVGIGGLDLAGVLQTAQRMVGGHAEFEAARYNRFYLNTRGARVINIPLYKDGGIQPVKTFVRGPRRLPLCGAFSAVYEAIKRGSDLVGHILPTLQALGVQSGARMEPQRVVYHLMQALELMVKDGWVRGERDPRLPSVDLSVPDEGESIHTNREINERMSFKGIIRHDL